MRSAPSIRPSAGASYGSGRGSATATAPVRPERSRQERRARPPAEPRRAPAAAPAGTPVRTPVAAPPSPQVDPRFSARRIAVQRDAGRRRLRRVAGIGALVGLLIGAAALTQTPLLDLDTIEVSGTTAAVSAEQVRAVVAEAGLELGTPLLTLDAGAAEAALEALPGIEDAQVTRHWPGAVSIELVERIPVAVVDLAGGDTALVGADGVVVAVEPGTAGTAGASGGAAGLLPIDGPPTLAVGDRVDAAAQLAVAAALPERIRPLVIAIGVTSRTQGVELRLAGSGVVRIGSADQLAEKLVAAETMLTQIDTSCVAMIDVQVPSVPTVNRRPDCG